MLRKARRRKACESAGRMPVMYYDATTGVDIDIPGYN
jgi:hypothetical protein